MKNNESPIQLNPVATQRASEAIYNQIAEMITSGQIKPGERLPSERTMMEMLGRSRPTIREALRMLERNGLIQIIAGSRGAVVVEPGSRSVQEPLENMLNMSVISSEELLEYRELNEVTTAGWAALRRTEEDLQKILAVLDSFDPTNTDFEDFSHKDIAFHQAISAAGHNRVASLVDKVIHRMVANILVKAYEKKTDEEKRAMMQNIYASHRQIYDAVADRNFAAASAAMERHMELFARDAMVAEE